MKEPRRDFRPDHRHLRQQPYGSRSARMANRTCSRSSRREHRRVSSRPPAIVSSSRPAVAWRAS